MSCHRNHLCSREQIAEVQRGPRPWSNYECRCKSHTGNLANSLESYLHYDIALLLMQHALN